MTRQIRDDLKFAAYAVHLGYTIDTRTERGFVAGIPQDGLQFTCHNGRVHVWETSRGWRVSALVDGSFTKAADHEFHKNLTDALEAGVKL